MKLWITFGVVVAMSIGVVAVDAWLVLNNFSSPIFGWRAPQTAFVVNSVLIIAAMLLIGYAAKGNLLSIIIDTRNRYTLAKLQAAAWSVLLLAGLIAASLTNLLRSSQGEPFDLKIPQEIFLAAGISLTSLAATPLIHSAKAGRTHLAFRYTERTTLLGDPGAKVVGQIYIASSPAATTWPDLFRGSDVGNFDEVDLGKVQLFYFTLITLAAYGYALFANLAGETPIAFPQLGQSFLTLLALSHGGYLAQESVPHTAG
jgi:hypothetical protein